MRDSTGGKKQARAPHEEAKRKEEAKAAAEEKQPVVEFAQGSIAVRECEPYATLQLVRRGASLRIDTVRYQTVSGTATAGEDYEDASGTVMFNVGQASRPRPRPGPRPV